jgi:predicted transposase YbfD/YdcC
VAVVLALTAAAVVGGMRSFTAIAGWVADVPGDLLRALYGASTATPPSKCTIWRVVTGADAACVDAAIGAWLAQRASTGAGDSEAGAVLSALMVDGKTVRGAATDDGGQVHLLAAATHGNALVLAQTDVAAKTNEIPMFEPLLDSLDIVGTVITADALHTQRRHAEYLHRRGADFVFWVKDNQPGLFAKLDALAWSDVAVTHTATDRGHGRVETRTIQIMPAPADLPFPHVQQVFLIERAVTDLHGRSLSNVAIFAITSLATGRGTPATSPA